MVVCPQFQFDLEDFCNKSAQKEPSEGGQCNLADLDLSRFQHYLVAIATSTVNNNGSNDQMGIRNTWNIITLAIVTERFLIITNDYYPLPFEKWRNRKVGTQLVGRGDIRKVLDLWGGRYRSASTISSSTVGDDFNVLDKPSALAWINEFVVSVGFDSGLVLCCNCEVQHSFRDSMKGEHDTDDFRVSVEKRVAASSGDVLLEFRGQISPVRSIKQLNDSIWILYENGYLIAVQIF